MSDFRNVRSGEPLRIKAPLQNALINNLFDREFRGRDIHGTAAFNQFVNNQRVVVRVKNTSGTDIDQYGILGLDTLIGTPGESPGDELEDEFRFLDYGFIGKDPDETKHKIRFCVAQQFIADGDVGTALISGTTPVKIDLPGGAKVVGQDLPRVGIKTGDKTKLFQQPWGAQVVWVDTEKAIDESFASWAIIDMGRQQPISGIPGIAKAAIVKDASGLIRETLVDGTEKGLPITGFSAINKGSDVILGDDVVWGVDRNGDAFFIVAEGGVAPCDCVEKNGTTDTYKQLSDYCDIVNINKVLTYAKELTFRVITEAESVQFVLEIDDDASFSTPIETTDPFFWKSTSQSVDMVTLTGEMAALKSGTHNAITIELKETADPGSQWSGLGGVQKISEYGESGPTGFQIHIVDDGGGFRHLDAFAPDGTTLLFHTATYNTTGDKAVIDDLGAGVTGTITIDAVGSPTTGGRWDWEKLGDTNSEFVGILIDDLFQKTREKVWLRKLSNTDFRVEIYSGGCKIGQTAFSKLTGAQTVSALTPSGWTCPALSGTITIDRWFHADHQILISCPNSECCGTDNCSGGNPASKGCITVAWNDGVDTGTFCFPGILELTDPGKCSDGSTQGGWQPITVAGVTDPDTLVFYALSSSAVRTTPCDDTITWQFNVDAASDVIIKVVNIGGDNIGIFTIAGTTYDVSYSAEGVDCTCQSAFPP